MTDKWRSWLVVFIALAWLFAVMFAYYVVHKPFGAENLLAILNALGDIFVALAIFGLAAALGRRLLSRLPFDDPLGAVILQTGFGLGIVSFATFALGLLGVLNPLLLWLALILSIFLLRSDLLATVRILQGIRMPVATRLERGLAVFSGFALALALLYALLPPTAWDAIQYHLIGPQLTLAQGRITPPPDNLSLSNPALVETLYLLVMALKGDVATQLVHFGYLLLALGLVMTLAQRYFSTRAGWLAVGLLLAVPSVWLVATWAYSDMALMFYTLAALTLVISYREKGRTSDAALAGVFAGMALGEKFTAAFVALALVLLIARPRRTALWPSAVFVICAAIVASPWYIRNWIFLGNPIYPFIWGGPFWDPFRTAWYSRFGTGLMNEPWRLVLVPWEMTVRGLEGGVEYQASIGPLLLAFIPLLLLTRNQRRPAATPALWWSVLVLYLAWLIGVAQSKLLSQTRLLFPAFPALALLAGDAFERLEQLTLPQFSLQRFATLLVGAILGLTALNYGLAFAADHPFTFLTGIESREQYLARQLGDYYTVTQFVNAQLPRDARILCLWETRAYYFQRDVNADAILDRFADLRYRYDDADGIAAYLRREGYTHVLLHRAGLDYMLQTGQDPISTQDTEVLNDLITRYLRPVYGNTPFQISAREDKPRLVGVDKETYALYEILPAK